MKAISQGNNTYDIFDDSLQVYEQLPAQFYVVRFSENRGFSLVKSPEMEIKEPKVYGVHDEKVQKVMKAFTTMNRSLGVILSGDKGIGKSLLAKMLAVTSIKGGMPVIIVDTYYPGIASYIEDIEQEVMILFDEFDKTFGTVRAKDGDASPQTQMLSLFDGISVGKKLFVVTCNELANLSDYLVNRPGRFHYHFRFEYPSVQEVRQYLRDKLPEKYHGEIEDVVSFSGKVNLNYDCLRAIAFELQMGSAFGEAIKDLNIINIEKVYYIVTLKYANGFTAVNRRVQLDMFGGEERETVYLYDNNEGNFVDVEFTPTDAVFDTSMCAHVITPDKFSLDYIESYVESCKAAKASEPECLVITRKMDKNIHYLA
jgi:hypothetical protein